MKLLPLIGLAALASCPSALREPGDTQVVAEEGSWVELGRGVSYRSFGTPVGPVYITCIAVRFESYPTGGAAVSCK